MRKLMIALSLAIAVAASGIFFWISARDSANNETVFEQRIDQLTFEMVRPGLEAATLVFSTRAHIGEEIRVLLFLRYDPNAFRIDEESIRNSRISPFEIRSVSRTELDPLDPGEKFDLLETRIQCVTCSPDHTYQFTWSILRYEDIAAGESRFIQIRFSIEEPFLFNPDQMLFRTYDMDHHVPLPSPFPPETFFFGGLALVSLAVLFLVLFIKGWERRVRDARMLSPGEELQLRIKQGRRALAKDPALDLHQFLDEFYFAIEKFVQLECGEDEFSPVLLKARKAYQNTEITTGEVREILGEIESCLAGHTRKERPR